jgi:hypothetical protein
VRGRVFFSRCHVVVWIIRTFDRGAVPGRRMRRVHGRRHLAVGRALALVLFPVAVAIQIPVSL